MKFGEPREQLLAVGEEVDFDLAAIALAHAPLDKTIRTIIRPIDGKPDAF